MCGFRDVKKSEYVQDATVLTGIGTRIMKECSIQNCNSQHHALGFCYTHYQEQYRQQHKQKQQQYNRKYRLRFKKERTQYSPNEYHVDGEVTKIALYNKKQELVEEAIIDTEDICKCETIKWCLSDGYVLGTLKKGKFPLSWIIIGKIKHQALIVDHINGNPLDNRKMNLQFITRQQNIMKGKHRSNNSSGYRGVIKAKNKRKWIAQIMCDYKNYRIGIFTHKTDAALAYNQKAKDLFSEFAVLNNIRRRTHDRI